MSEEPGREGEKARERGGAKEARRKTPAHFRITGSSLVADLLTGAEEVADRSFLGAGGKSASPRPIPPTPPAAPAPDPLPVPVPVPVSVPVPLPVPERVAQVVPEPRPPLCGAWAHAAVHESFADAKLGSAKWKSYGFRIAPEVLARLKSRVNADRRATGNANLAIGHYIDGALRHMPHEVSELIGMAEDFGARQLWDSEKTQPSTYRVGESAYALAAGLKMMLQEADYGRRGTLVVSAGVEAFLDALEAQGPLPRPERRR